MNKAQLEAQIKDLKAALASAQHAANINQSDEDAAKDFMHTLGMDTTMELDWKVILTEIAVGATYCVAMNILGFSVLDAALLAAGITAGSVLSIIAALTMFLALMFVQYKTVVPATTFVINNSVRGYEATKHAYIYAKNWVTARRGEPVAA